MACRQIGKLNPTDGEKGIGTDEKRVGPRAREAFKGCLVLPLLLALAISTTCNAMAQHAALLGS
jgi:hypothetical protein